MGIKLLTGDCREILPTLPAQSVHCCVTSPPYFGLRDYGTATWEGGEADCDHRRFNGYVSGLDGGKEAQDIGKLFKDECGKCGARRVDSQIGLEPTPDAYVAQLVAVFREVRRVLRDDGTLWLNLGDSYAANRSYQVSQSKHQTHDYGKSNAITIPDGLKPKDLIGIPWRVAFALQADGWWLRQDIIWSKPNAMPESVTDRCTKAHEYIFLLSKSARYFYDADAIAEPLQASTLERGYTAAHLKNGGGPKEKSNSDKRIRQGKGWWDNPYIPTKRNKRSVWEVATQPYADAHFATFPPSLIEPCIKAGCPEGGAVLDPFGGVGTTGMVADRLARDAVLIELNPAYAGMARMRITDDAPLFADVVSL